MHKNVRFACNQIKNIWEIVHQKVTKQQHQNPKRKELLSRRYQRDVIIKYAAKELQKMARNCNAKKWGTNDTNSKRNRSEF